MLGVRSLLRNPDTFSGQATEVATPSMVFEHGKPVAAISVAGGDLQDQVTLQLLLGYIEFGLTPAEAVTAPRFATNHLIGSFNQPPPRLGSLSIYEAVGKETIEALKAEAIA